MRLSKAEYKSLSGENAAHNILEAFLYGQAHEGERPAFLASKNKDSCPSGTAVLTGIDFFYE